jgi:hypothetical protein
MRHSLLYFGSYELLVETRRLIFEEAGYAVVTTVSVDEALLLLSKCVFNAVVVCSSVPESFREQIRKRMESVSSETALVQLNPAVPSYTSDPDLLLALVAAAIRSKERAALPPPRRPNASVSGLSALKLRKH